VHPLPLRYVDVAWWQRQSNRGARADEKVALWRDRLTGAPAVAELPFDPARPAVSRHRGSTLLFEPSAGTAAAVAQVGRSNGATPFMVLLAGFTALVARYSRSRDIVIGTPTANRTREELNDVVGFLANMVVLHVDCTDDPAFSELL